MSVQATQPTHLECLVARDLSYGFLSPISNFFMRLALSNNDTEHLDAAKIFMEKHLSVTVDLKNPRIQELFDQALQNSVTEIVSDQLESIADGRKRVCMIEHMSRTLADLRGKTWIDTAKEKISQISNATKKAVERSSWSQVLTQHGITSDNSSGPIFTDDDDECVMVETSETLEKKLTAILKRWQQNPSLALEAFDAPSKQSLSEIRNLLISSNPPPAKNS